MTFHGFAVGLRFALTEASAISEHDIFQILLSRVPAELVKGMDLYRMDDSSLTYTPEPSVLFVFANCKLDKARALYRHIACDLVLNSYLTTYEPIIQFNRLERCDDVLFIGSIDNNGAINGGSIIQHPARFSGIRISRSPNRSKTFLCIAGEPTTIGSANDAVRMMLRIVGKNASNVIIRILPICESFTDTVIAFSKGRYGFTKSGIRYGILPNRTVVFDSINLTFDELNVELNELFAYGYRNAYPGAFCNEFSIEQSEMHLLSSLDEVLSISDVLHGVDAALISNTTVKNDFLTRLIKIAETRGIPCFTLDATDESSVLRVMNSMCDA